MPLTVAGAFVLLCTALLPSIAKPFYQVVSTSSSIVVLEPKGARVRKDGRILVTTNGRDGYLIGAVLTAYPLKSFTVNHIAVPLTSIGNDMVHRIRGLRGYDQQFEFGYSIPDSVQSFRAEMIDMVGTTSRCLISVVYEERDTIPPRVMVMTPEATQSKSGELNAKENATAVTISGIATDNKGIQMVFINSNPCVLSEPTPEELRGRQLENESMKFEQTVSLGTGLNTFEIVALDVSGRISTTILRINGGPKSTTTLPKTWAVVVGVSEFKDPTLNLHYAANDARLFYDFLRGVKGGELPENQIELLMNADATRANILRKVEEKTDKAGSDDRVILYFATHGAPAPKGNEAYLFSTDTDPGNLVGTGVAWNDIDKQLALSAAKDVIILTDACHEAAGNAIALRSAQGLETHNLLEKIAMTKKGIVYFSASTANEFSREGEKWGGHGVFTKYLVAGLDGAADRNRDGIVTITELEDYVRANVLDETNGLQRPGIKGDYIDGLIMSITR